MWRPAAIGENQWQRIQWRISVTASAENTAAAGESGENSVQWQYEQLMTASWRRRNLGVIG